MIRERVPPIPTEFVARYHAATLELHDAADEMATLVRRSRPRWSAAREAWLSLEVEMADALCAVTRGPRGPVIMDARMTLMGSLFDCLAALVGETYPRLGDTQRCAVCHKASPRGVALPLRSAEHAAGCAWVAAHDLVREIEGETVLLDPADWMMLSQALGFAAQKAQQPEQKAHMVTIRERIDRAAISLRRPRGEDAVERLERRREIARRATRRYREKKKAAAVARVAGLAVQEATA